MDFSQTINSSLNHLCKKNDKLLLCVSGGIDSVVLFDVVLKGGWDFSVAHCNFSLRGEESDGDELYVKSLCKKYGITCHVIKFDTNKYSRENGVNTQIAARELRYDYFFRLKEEFKYDKIVIAHHLDDSIETFFINLLRGTGIKGLSGISDTRNDIIRPMLWVTRAQINSYAETNSITHREDSSNSHDHYLRNKLRHHIIPSITAISEKFREVMSDNLQHLNQAEKFIESSINSIRESISKDGIHYEIDKIKNNENFSFILFRLFSVYGFNSDVISQLEKAIQNGETGKIFISTKHRLLLQNNMVSVHGKSEPEISERELPDVEITPIDMIGDYRNLGKNTIAIDADKVTLPLKIRKWRPGDRIRPLGMKGSKTIGDFLTDRKISLIDRESVNVLTDAKDGIIWIIGIQPDDRYKITDKTIKVIKLVL